MDHATKEKARPALPTATTSYRYYLDMYSRYINGTMKDKSGASYIPPPSQKEKFLLNQYIEFWTDRMRHFIDRPTRSGLPFMAHDATWPTFPSTALTLVQAICLTWYKEMLQEYTRQKEEGMEGAINLIQFSKGLSNSK
jgi:hypothetical protein